MHWESSRQGTQSPDSGDPLMVTQYGEKPSGSQAAKPVAVQGGTHWPLE